MKIKSLSFILCLSVATIAVFAQTPVIRWQKTIGGNYNDSLVSIIPTYDNGFIISGHSNSNISGSKTENSLGTYDYWIVKLNGQGKIEWNKTLGGAGVDRDPVIIQTGDGGYVVGGTSISNISGNKTEDAINGSDDYWVVKIDSKGTVLWDNTIGAVQKEELVSIVEDPIERTLRVAGNSYTNYANFDKTINNRGSSLWSDYWFLKLDGKGKVLSDYLFGGGNEDILTTMRPVKDSGYILGGYSYSQGENDKTDTFIGNCDYWIVRIDANGNRKWDKTIGGINSDYETDVQQTIDRGFILGGYSNSPVSFNKTETRKGVLDYWIVKTDSNGVVKWDKTYGGTKGDYLSSIAQTADSGYIMGGTSSSNISSDKSENSKGLEDYWIVKLDSAGKIVWDKTYGGSRVDRLSVIKEISRDEYIIGGTSNSPVSGDKTDKTVGGKGFNDYWIIRMSTAKNAKPAKQTSSLNNAVAANTLNINKLSMQASPNPTKGLVTVTYSASGSKNISLAVYGNNGKTVLNRDLPSNKSTYTLNISQQAAGVYYVVLTSDKSTVTRVIVKD